MTAATPAIDIRGSGSSWAVYCGDMRLTNFVNTFDKACIAVRVWDRRLRATDRPCLCCGTMFTSYGKGHRMCDPCREQARQALL